MDRDEIKALRERQNELCAEARREYTDKVTDETPAEEQRELEAKFDQYMVEVDQIEARIERAIKLVEAEERAENDPANPMRRPHSGDNREADEPESQRGGGEAPEWTESRAFIRYCTSGEAGLPAEARALLRSSSLTPPEKRAMSTTVAAGGYTIPEGFSERLEKNMVAWGPMMDPSITGEVVTPDGRKIPWPTVDDTANTGELHSEGGAVTVDTATPFGERELDAYVYDSEVVQVSIELMDDSFFDFGGILADLLGERLGRINNTHLTTGTGSSQPNGIITASTVGKTTASNSAITFDEIIDLIHSVDPAYRQSPRLGFIFNDSTLSTVRKVKDGQGNYLWQPADARTGEPASLFGHRYYINQAVASIATTAKVMAFGDLSKYVVRKVDGTTLLRLNELYAANLQVGFLAYNRIDGELIATNAVKVMQMAV